MKYIFGADLRPSVSLHKHLWNKEVSYNNLLEPGDYISNEEIPFQRTSLDFLESPRANP